jgi:hypothetical protein
MTSNLKRTLGGMLTLAVVLSAAEVRAQKLEKPGVPPADAAPSAAAAAGPATFGDSGQFILSAERLFGLTYTHQSFGAAPAGTETTFTLLAAPFGANVAGYIWPRVGFDYVVAKNISVGGVAAFYRTSAGNTSQTGFEVAPRLGYATMVGPWLGVWPRIGVTYNHASGGGATLQYLGLTVEGLLAFVVGPHFVLTFGPTLDLGLSGSRTMGTLSTSAKITDVGAYFGFAVPF